MSESLEQLGNYVIAHYGSALKEGERNSSGPFLVYGSSGEVGHHDQALVSAPTIIVGRKGSVGAVTYAPNGGWPIDTTYYLEVRAPERVELRYLYWALSRAGLERRAITTSIPGLNREELYRTRVLLPPLAEQRRIAAVLDKADAIRRRRRESLRLLDDFLRSAFLEMFGDPVRNEKGWVLRRIGDVTVDAQYGTSARANSHERGLPVLRMNNLTQDGRIDLAHIKWCEIPPGDLPKYTVRRGDLLFNRTNSPALVGKTAVWDRDETFAFAGYLIRVRLDESRVLPDFACGYLNSPYGKRMLFERAKPSINMSNISATQLKRFLIPTPSLEAQRRYAALAERVKKTRERMLAAQPIEGSLFDSLAHQTFRGKREMAPDLAPLGRGFIARPPNLG